MFYVVAQGSFNVTVDKNSNTAPSRQALIPLAAQSPRRRRKSMASLASLALQQDSNHAGTNEDTNDKTKDKTKDETKDETKADTNKETNEETNEETNKETNEETNEETKETGWASIVQCDVLERGQVFGEGALLSATRMATVTCATVRHLRRIYAEFTPNLRVLTRTYAYLRVLDSTGQYWTVVHWTNVFLTSFRPLFHRPPPTPPALPTTTVGCCTGCIGVRIKKSSRITNSE